MAVIVVHGMSTTTERKSWMFYGAEDCFNGNSKDYQGTVSKATTHKNGLSCMAWNSGYHEVKETPPRVEDHSTNYCRATEDGGEIWCYLINAPIGKDDSGLCSVVSCNGCYVDQRLPPPPIPRSTRVISAKSHVPTVTFLCDSLSCNVSRGYCPVSTCRGNNQWSTNYSLSCSNEDCYVGKSDGYRGKIYCTISGILCQKWNVNTPHVAHHWPSDPEAQNSNYCRNPVGSGHNGRPWCYTTNPRVRWMYCPVSEC